MRESGAWMYICWICVRCQERLSRSLCRGMPLAKSESLRKGETWRPRLGTAPQLGAQATSRGHLHAS
eukprot:5892924-Pyramimonas_sp.AAC.1